MDIKCLGNPKKRYTTCRFWTNHKCKKHPDFCNYVHSYVCPDRDQCERFDCTLLHFNQARKIVLHRRKVTEHAASKKPRAVQSVREHRTNLPGANNTSVFKWSAISPNWHFNNSALKDNSASETNSPSFDDFDEDLCEGLEEVGQELDRFAEEVSESRHCEDEVICLTEQENRYSKHSSSSTTCYNKNLLNRTTVSEAPIELKRNPTKVASKVELLRQAKELAHKGKNAVSKEVKKGLQCVMGLKTRNESMQIIKPHRRDVLQLEEENKHATSHTMLKMPLVTDSQVQNGSSTSLGSPPIVDLKVPAIVVTGSLSITNTHPKQANFLVQSSSSHTSKISLADNSLHNVNSRIINGTASHTSPVDKTVSHTSAVDKTVSHTSPVDKTVSPTSPVDKTVSHTSAVNKAVSHTSAVNKTVSHTSAMTGAGSHTSAVDKTVSHTSAIDKTVSHTSPVDKTVSPTSPVDKTVSHTSAVNKAVSHTSAVNKTVSHTSAVNGAGSHTSAVDKTVSHTSAVNKTVSHTSAVNGAGFHTSAVDKTVSHTSAMTGAGSHTSAIDKTVSHTSAVNKAVSHTSAVNKTVSHTSAVNGAGSHTSAVDKTVSHTSAVNKTVSHTSAVNGAGFHTSAVDKTVSHTSAMNGAGSHASAVDKVSHTLAVNEAVHKTVSHTSAVDEIFFNSSAVDGVVSHPSVVGGAVSHPSAVDGAVSCLSAVDIKEATNSGYKNNLSPKESKIIDEPSKALQEVKHSDTNVKLATRNSSNDCLSGLAFKEGWPVSFSNSSQPINQSENSTLGETGEDKVYELKALLSQKKQLVNKIKSLVKQKKNLSLQRDYVISNCSGDTTKLSQIFEENSQITKKISDKILICNAQIKLTNQKINDLENSKSFKTTTGILLKEDDTNKEQVISLGCFISSNEQAQNYEEYFNHENLSNKDKMFEKRYSESQELSHKEEKLVNVHHKDVNSPTEELLKGSHEIQTPQMPELEGKKEALQQNNQDGKWLQVPSIQQKQNVNKVSNILRSGEKPQSQQAPHMPELEGKKEALQQNNQDGKWLPVHFLQYNKTDNSICNIARSSRNITSQQEQCQQTQFPGSAQENYIVHDKPVSKDGSKCDESSHHKGKMPDSSKDLSTHWCRVCNMFFTHVYGYVKHLESSSHMGKIKDESRKTWMQKIPQYKTKNHSEIIQGNPDTVGAEFLHSTTIFFCELCESIFWNTQDAALHPQSTIHAQKYKEHIQKNTNQERCFLTAKMNAFTEYFKERKAKSQKTPTKEITKGIIAEGVNKQSEDGTKEGSVLHKSESLLSHQSDGLSNKRKSLARKGYNKRPKFAQENQNTNWWY